MDRYYVIFFQYYTYNAVFHITIKMCILIFGFNLIMLVCKYFCIITNLIGKKLEMVNNIQGGTLKSNHSGRTITVSGDIVTTKEELLFQEWRDEKLLYSPCIYYCVKLVIYTLLFVQRTNIFPSFSLVDL